MDRRRSLVFAINGERFELFTVEPSMTVLEFIRTKTRYRGPKLGCGEGGCGACVVLLSRFNPASRQIEEFSVSSCLTLLCSVHLCSITTTEGLGNSKDGFHSIHQRFSGFHASQCGFCTPGMCMSLFSALNNADKSDRPDPPAGFSKITMSEAEMAIAGNLCRCTGYRPILDACKSFASDVDIEDLGLNSYWRKGESDADVRKLPFYNCSGMKTFPDFLKAEIEKSLGPFCFLQAENEFRNHQLNVPDEDQDKHAIVRTWYHANSIDEVGVLLRSQRVEGCKRVKLVVGNTGSGIYKDIGHYDMFIDLKGIPELSLIKRDISGIEFGAAVTISKAIEALGNRKESQSNESLVYSKIADYLSKVGSQFVRNMATLGGNLVMAQKYQFASDIATVLLSASSSVSYVVNSEKFVVTLEEFLAKPPFDSDLLLMSIKIPSWNRARQISDSEDSYDIKRVGESKLLFETYRAAPRPLGNAVAYANATFLANLSARKRSGEVVIENLRLVFGAEKSIRARTVENYLVGKSVSASVMLKAINLLREVVLAKEGISYPAYHSSVAVGFLFDFLQTISTSLLKPSIVPENTVKIEELNNARKYITENEYTHARSIDEVDHCTLLLSSKQVVKFSRDYHPVGEPIEKCGAEIQASGEAIYVDDIPSPKDCLYGAFIYSTKPMVLIKQIEIDKSMFSREFISVISVKDIPVRGKNIGSVVLSEAPLFADSISQCAGESLAFVVAKTQRIANMAAAKALVDYETIDLQSPILSVDEAVERSSFYEVPLYLIPKQIGDFSIGMERADHKILSEELKLGSQYYFYMETQTALAIPDEDNGLVVYSSCQSPMKTQEVISKCIGVPCNNVRVITRRVGGGFGGKAIRSMPIATACALAAHKLGRPVRTYLDRKTDMVISGGRHPMTINYTVGYKSDGKITALHVELLIDAGIAEDMSPGMPYNIIGALKKYDWGAFTFDFKVCKTNLTSKSAMRGPGEVQGSFIAEAIIEHVASILPMDSDSIRMINLHTYESLKLFYECDPRESAEYTLPYIVERLALSAGLEDRVEKIKQFNKCNRWKKRGISRVPIIHPVNVLGTTGRVSILSDASVVVEVGGVELGQGLWTKVKQMVAFSLGKLCTESDQNLLDRVRVIQADTLSLIQGGFTSGSTTSESSCEAARLACDMLVERLMPIKDLLRQQSGDVSWDALIQQGNFQEVNLSASTYFVPESDSKNYLNYGAAISEVEVDLLTGETKILRSDLIYDCGKSLNPAVDLGQIEGAFVQGIGFFMLEEYSTNADGLVTSDGTWTYKIPTVDTVPRQFNVEIINSGEHKRRVLSSKASGEPPLLLAVSVHCATREAIKEARKDLFSYCGSKGSPLVFQLPVPATMPVVKELCGFDIVERFLETIC